MERSLLLAALRIVRTIAGLVMLVIVAATLLVPSPFLLAAAPVCASRVAGAGECPLCGMTGGFVAVASGDLPAAAACNAAALPLYVLFTLGGGATLADLALRRWRRRPAPPPFRSQHPQEQPCNSSASCGGSLR